MQNLVQGPTVAPRESPQAAGVRGGEKRTATFCAYDSCTEAFSEYRWDFASTKEAHVRLL